MENICCQPRESALGSAVTMSMLEPGSKGVIKDFLMNCEDSHSCRFVRRMKEIGLYLGATFEVLKNSGNGEITIACEGCTLALGRGMADKISVEVSGGAVMTDGVMNKLSRIFGIRCRS
jgi:Fe2+ transport system protein FeoA